MSTISLQALLADMYTSRVNTRQKYLTSVTDDGNEVATPFRQRHSYAHYIQLRDLVPVLSRYSPGGFISPGNLTTTPVFWPLKGPMKSRLNDPFHFKWTYRWSLTIDCSHRCLWYTSNCLQRWMTSASSSWTFGRIISSTPCQNLRHLHETKCSINLQVLLLICGNQGKAVD